MSSIHCSRVGGLVEVIGSEQPIPRRSQRMRRLKEASRRVAWTNSGCVPGVGGDELGHQQEKVEMSLSEYLVGRDGRRRSWRTASSLCRSLMPVLPNPIGGCRK